MNGRFPDVMVIDKPGVYAIPARDYHADPVIAPSLSSSVAQTLILRSPFHAWHEHPRLNPKYESEEKTEFDRGSATHALLLEGEDRMVVVPYPDYRKGEAREVRDSARGR